MSRLIDADALLDSIKIQMLDEDYDITCVIPDIENAPTIEAEPVMHGRWEYVKKRLARGGYVDASECSVCHKIIFPYVNMNYCPYCGAKMDGGKSDE